MGARSEQKERTREEILSSSIRLLRERGISGASVAEVMKSAGLTVGGFYAHFDSKESLVGISLRQAIRQLRTAELARHEGKRGSALLERVITRYLSAAHRDHPEQGCPLPAVAGEAARSGTPIREGIAAELSDWAEQLGAHLPGAPRAARRRALAVLALMVGGLTLSRAVRGTKLSDEILEVCRELARGAVGQPEGGTEDGTRSHS